jgi:hypothetical protein
MFFDNIVGISDNNDNYDDKSLDNREGKVCPVTGLIPCKCNNAGENDRYSLKNISLRQGRAFLKDEKKLNRMNTYLAQNTGNSQIVGMRIEGFENGSQEPQAAIASAAASSTPETVLSKDTAATTSLDKLDDAFDSKMAAYSSALSEFNKELLKSQKYFVVPVKSLTPINSCFNCDASLGGTDCSAMGISNSNGDIQTALPDSTSPTANLLSCVQAAGLVTVPGWSKDPNDSNSCIAPLGQTCCNSSMYNGQPVCSAGFNNYGVDAMNTWIAKCITPPSPEEITQKNDIANKYCQGNGISLNYWSQNVNKFVIVTTEERVGFRPFARMNNIPVWMCDLGDTSGVNAFTNLQAANKAKSDLVFSPTVEKTLTSARQDMLNAATALTKAVSSQQSTTAAERKAVEQKISSIRSKISKLDSHKQLLDKTAGIDSSSSVKESFTSSLYGQEEDTRIQFKSSYAYYTVWFVIAILLIIVMFSNIFYTKDGEGGEGESSSSSSITLIIGTLAMIVFIYFIIQYIMSYFKVSRPVLPFGDFNPLL